MKKIEEEWASKDVFCCFGNRLGCSRDLWSPLQFPWALPAAVVIHTVTPPRVVSALSSRETRQG